MPTFKSEIMQAVNTYTEYPSRIGTEMPDKNTCYMLSEAENRMQQILHITPAQMRFVAERIREHIDDTVSKQPRKNDECPEDIDERRGGIEVIGHGLDASVEFYAISYNRADGGDEEDVWGYGVSFARLVTYVNGGNQIANDCSSERLTRVVDEYLRKSLWIE